MRDGDALALDDVDAERGRVEEHVAEMVVEEVDLVDVEDAPVRLREEPRLERHRSLSQRAGDVDGAGDAVLGRVERKVDHAHAPTVRAEQLSSRDPRPRQAGHGSAGSHENGQSATTSISGRSSASPRTAVDFPVPLGPSTSTPPTAGLTALSRSACTRRSCSTIAVNGYRLTSEDERLAERGLRLRDRREVPRPDQRHGGVAVHLHVDDVRLARPRARSRSAEPRSAGCSTEIPPAPIASAIFAKSGFQNSPVDCLTKLVPISRPSM